MGFVFVGVDVDTGRIVSPSEDEGRVAATRLPRLALAGVFGSFTQDHTKKRRGRVFARSSLRLHQSLFLLGFLDRAPKVSYVACPYQFPVERVRSYCDEFGFGEYRFESVCHFLAISSS